MQHAAEDVRVDSADVAHFGSCYVLVKCLLTTRVRVQLS